MHRGPRSVKGGARMLRSSTFSISGRTRMESCSLLRAHLVHHVEPEDPVSHFVILLNYSLHQFRNRLYCAAKYSSNFMS
jgi:hypothetical protein